jgi:hypothetical protein
MPDLGCGTKGKYHTILRPSAEQDGVAKRPRLVFDRHLAQISARVQATVNKVLLTYLNLCSQI